MEEKILIVEDNKEIIDLLIEILTSKKFSFDYVSSGISAIEKIKKENYNLIILDLQLPDIEGFKVLEEIKKLNENISVIILTGFGTTDNIVKAIKMGADDFIEKPFDIKDFLEKIYKYIKLKSLERELTKFKMIESILQLNRTIITLSDLETILTTIINILDNMFTPERIGIYIFDTKNNNYVLKKYKFKNVLQKIKVIYKNYEIERFFKDKNVYVNKFDNSTDLKIIIKGKEKIIGFLDIEFKNEKPIKEEEIKFFESFSLQIGIGIENAILFEMVQNSYVNTIGSLVKSLEAKDKYTKGHSEEVAYYALLIGEKLKLRDEEIEILKNSSYLHDLGKLGIRDNILLKPGKLTEEEFEIIKQHPLITLKILEPLNLRKEEKEACLYHHERIDGSGYPYGLKDEKIPLYAKIIAIADAYSAMTSERPYRKKLSKREAIEELKKYAGIWFDKELVEFFINLIEQQKEVIGNEGN
ncbi:MAG: response regulator [Candidatus Omnitrophica bacterium]|nr:response regulator [Candidatus Omnitrophota bacterium]MCM8802419.1 response regulator [Candidatus Omnitrophota bacterium]